MPKVTAIISSYYADQYIGGRLENLAEQQVPGGLEVIVVAQQGSKESAIVRTHMSGQPGLSLLETPDIPTVYEAWNIAIQKATGDYLTNANSDDRHYPGAIAALAKALDENPKYAAAYFDVDRVKELKDQEAPTTMRFELLYEKRIDKVGTFTWLEGGLRELYWQGCFLGPMPMWCRSVHSKIGWFDPHYTSAGDYEFWMRMAAAGMQFFHVRGEPLGAHLEKENALEHRSPVRSTIEAARAKAKHRQQVGDV